MKHTDNIVYMRILDYVKRQKESKKEPEAKNTDRGEEDLETIDPITLPEDSSIGTGSGGEI